MKAPFHMLFGDFWNEEQFTANPAPEDPDKFTEKTVVRSCKKHPFLTASETVQTLPIMIAPFTVRKILCKCNLKAKVYNKNLIISL